MLFVGNTYILNNWLLKSLNDFGWFFTQSFYIALNDLEHSTQEWTMFCNTFMVLFGYWQALYIFTELNRAAWKFCKRHYFVFNVRKSVKWFWNKMRESKYELSEQTHNDMLHSNCKNNFSITTTISSYLYYRNTNLYYWKSKVNFRDAFKLNTASIWLE